MLLSPHNLAAERLQHKFQLWISKDISFSWLPKINTPILGQWLSWSSWTLGWYCKLQFNSGKLRAVHVILKIILEWLWNSITGIFIMMRKRHLLLHREIVSPHWFENTCLQALTVVIRQMTKRWPHSVQSVTTQLYLLTELPNTWIHAGSSFAHLVNLEYAATKFMARTDGKPRRAEIWLVTWHRATISLPLLITCMVQVTLPTSTDTLWLPAVNTLAPNP
jgi:hypothetical protein